MSQLALAFRAGQLAPPSEATLLTVRDRNFELPDPQLRLHACQASQLDTAQSTGHVALVHAAVLLRSGHAVPAPSFGIVTVRVRKVDPEPHVAEQPPQAVQDDATQATGQGSDPQTRSPSVLGHSLPELCAAVVIVRVRV